MTTYSNKFIPKKPETVQPYRRSFHSEIPSVTFRYAMTEGKKESQTYTGDRLIGISIVHKSCLQPIFSQKEATEVASMRR